MLEHGTMKGFTIESFPPCLVIADSAESRHLVFWLLVLLELPQLARGMLAHGRFSCKA